MGSTSMLGAGYQTGVLNGQYQYVWLQKDWCIMFSLKLYVHEIWSILWHFIIYTALYSAFRWLLNSICVVYYLKWELAKVCLFVCLFFAQEPQWAVAYSFTMFVDQTQRRTAFGRTPLDEWSTRRSALYLTTLTRNAHSSVGFEPTIPACERPQTYAFVRSKSVPRTAAYRAWENQILHIYNVLLRMNAMTLETSRRVWCDTIVE
jgi:hypothetical protein